MNFQNNHCFSDESNQNIGKFRSISCFSCSAQTAEKIKSDLDKLWEESGVNELKWNKTSSARERLLIEKIYEYIFPYILKQEIRIDVIIWDIEDRRHSIKSRDDSANLGRMYHHLYGVVFNMWPVNTDWSLFPDKQSIIDWEQVGYFLNLKEYKRADTRGKQLKIIPNINASNTITISSIKEIDSTENKLIQVANHFSGISCFSYARYDKYLLWCESKNMTPSLFPNNSEIPTFSNSEKERFCLLSLLNEKCKKYSMQVALTSTNGLFSHKPQKGLNFWLYEPQGEYDKAPVIKY